MKSLRIEDRGKVRWIELASPNCTLTSGLISELQEEIGSHREDAASRVLVLAGSGGKFFSPGFNLGEVAPMTRSQMSRMIEGFERLFLDLLVHPKPTLAMLNGSALAGGCIVASSCDFRISREGSRIGMTPLNHAISIPYGAQQIIARIIGWPRARRSLQLGESYSSAEAEPMGWIDGSASGERLESETSQLADTLSSINPAAFETTKSMLLDSLTRRVIPPQSSHREAFLDCWFSPQAQRRLHEASTRLGG